MIGLPVDEVTLSVNEATVKTRFIAYVEIMNNVFIGTWDWGQDGHYTPCKCWEQVSRVG